MAELVITYRHHCPAACSRQGQSYEYRPEVIDGVAQLVPQICVEGGSHLAEVHRVRRLAEPSGHCSEHPTYDPTCHWCVDALMKAKGLTACGHTDAEGCTGHGDF